MKIRLGFVSNSSSSSFVVVAKKKVHDEVMSKLHPFIQAVMKAIEPSEEFKFLGEDIIVFGYHSDMGGYDNLEGLDIEYDGIIPALDNDDGDGEEMSYYDAFYEYREAIKKAVETDAFEFHVE